MFDLTNLPQSIANKIHGLEWECDKIGMSSSTVLLFEKSVLKIEKLNRSSKNEYQLLKWLDGKIPIPKIIEADTQNGYSFLLMSKLYGEMSCSDNNLKNIESTVKALASGLKMLWQVDITNCPFCNDIQQKLIQAKYNIENDLVDMDNVEPDTFGSEGFADALSLYNYLDKSRPADDYVFTHGDFCLPNVFVGNGSVTGFLDWGNGGIADRWQDIALCVRSLRSNCIEYGGYNETEFEKYKNILFDELGIEPNEEKIRYYILLDELF